MSQKHRVVVGVGPHGKHDAALELAALEANRRGCDVHLVVVAHPFLDEQRSLADLELVDGELRRAHTSLLLESEAILRSWMSDRDRVSTELTHGTVAKALVAQSEDAELVVLQHHHMGRAFHVPTLSITNAVAARAHAPVVAVPDDWHEGHHESRPGGETEPVVACVQHGQAARAVAQAGFEAARRMRVPLRLLQSWGWTDAEPDDEELFTAPVAERMELLRDRLRAEVRPVLEANADVPVVVDVQHGQPGYVLTQAGDHARLLVVGRHDPTYPLGSHLGPIARTVLTYARIPVLVVDTHA